MANFQLVILPLLLSVLFLFCALLFFVVLKKSETMLEGYKVASVFGYSLVALGGFSLFISLFFLVSG